MQNSASALEFREDRLAEGIQLFQSGQMRQAVELLGQAASQNPSCPTTRNWYASALFHNGNLPEALQEYRVVLQLDPYNGQVVETIRQIEVQLQQAASQRASGSNKALGVVLMMIGVPVAIVGVALCATVIGLLIGVPICLVGGAMFGYGFRLFFK